MKVIFRYIEGLETVETSLHKILQEKKCTLQEDEN